MSGFFFFVKESPLMCHVWRYCLLADARPQVPKKQNKNAPMRRDFHKLWPIKSQLFDRNNTFSGKYSPKFCDAGKKSDKYHLLLMSLRTFGASLGGTALHHCITTR